MLFGGRVAEEMIFGPEQVTTGAGNDIERATQMARKMVTRFGMSDLVGLMAIGDSDHEVFLGREITQKRDISEHTAQLVDQEVKRTLDDAHQRAREVLEREQPLLESIASALLERETLDRDEVELLSQGKALPPLELAANGDEADEGPGPEASDEDAPTSDGTEPLRAEGSGDPEDESEDLQTSAPGEKAPIPSTAARLSREEPDPDPSRG
jgi:cell division protease FtsH